MKTKSILMGMAVMVAVFFGCKKENSVTPAPIVQPVDNNAWLYGTWDLVQNKLKESDPFISSANLGWYLEFYSNGNFVLSTSDTPFYGTYTIKNNIITGKVNLATVTYEVLENKDNWVTIKWYNDKLPGTTFWSKMVKRK